MHIFLYEWTTGGGLVESPGGLPGSLVREGVAMVRAIATDLSRIEGCRVSLLRDPRILNLALPQCELVDVLSAWSHSEEFERFAAEADATILIAPEFDEILWKAARSAALSGATLFSPSPEFIRLASDKQRVCDALRKGGVPTADGMVLDSEEPLPGDFRYPAVIKPLDGAGSQDIYLVTSAQDKPPAYAWPRRLERYMPGLAASVAVLCGGGGHVVLAPTRQRISDDGRFRYLGGELPLAPGLAERAHRLANLTMSALPRAIGYVGIDLILGPSPGGEDDVVVEINPRLTTSYVGLRALATANLAAAMCEIAAGGRATVQFGDRPLEFDPEGNVSYKQ